MNNVSWRLFDHFDVQKGIREQGGVIDTKLGPEDAEYWKAHPDEYPDELKKKTVFLWNTLEISEGFRRITLMFWLIDEVETYELLV
ncbi:MAG: hypothetical protein WBL19_00260 [Minisyncoccia bacterium]